MQLHLQPAVVSCALIAATDVLSAAETLFLQSSGRGVQVDSACVVPVTSQMASCQTFSAPGLSACGPMGGYRHVCCCGK